ncbi:MAG: TspO/MBR family protein [Candidatus Aenigmatarchaeota archaeon]
MNKWLKLIISIVACQLAGIIGSVFTTSSITTWYVGLEKPWFTPPNWLFGPVWITLYTLMGISLFWIWQKGPSKANVRSALLAFFGQLAINAVWSIVFFGLQAPLYALVLIVMMWALILLTITMFYKIDKKAALILIPYIAWVTVATFLNYYVWILN